MSSLPRNWFNRNNKRSSEAETAASRMNNVNMNGNVNQGMQMNNRSFMSMNSMSLENMPSMNTQDLQDFIAANSVSRQSIDSLGLYSNNSNRKQGPLNGPALPSEWMKNGHQINNNTVNSTSSNPNDPNSGVPPQDHTVSSAISLLSIKSSLSNGSFNSFPQLPRDWMRPNQQQPQPNQQMQQTPQQYQQQLQQHQIQQQLQQQMHQQMHQQQLQQQKEQQRNMQMNSDTLNSYNDSIMSSNSLGMNNSSGPPLPVDWTSQYMKNNVRNDMQKGFANMSNTQNSIPQMQNNMANAQTLQQNIPRAPANPMFARNGIPDGNGRNEGKSQQANSSEMIEKDDESNILASATGANSRWNSWSHDEEVFLVAAVFDRLYRRGSLASSTKGESKDCWTNIKVFYDMVWAKHSNAAAGHNVERSTTALSRHYKIMKERASQAEKAGHQQLYFKVFLEEWETVYNKNNRLIDPKNIPI